MRENAIPKVIKREYYYLRIMKRIKPKFMELESWMIFQVDFYAVYESRVIIEPAIVKMAQGYFDMSYFDKALQQAKMLKSNKEHEKVFVRALNTENLKNMQILIDKNGHEYAVERDDPYGDEEDSDLEETKQLIKGKGATAQRIKQRKMLGKEYVMKDNRFAPQSRATTTATPVNKRNESSRQGSKGQIASPRANNRGGRILGQRTGNVARQGQQTAHVSGRRNTPSHEPRQAKQQQGSVIQSDEESYQLSRSESKPRRIKTSHANGQTMGHGSAQKPSNRSGNGTVEARHTHTGFFSRQNRSKEAGSRHSREHLHSRENQSIEYDERKTVGRVSTGDHKGTFLEKPKLPVIRILDKKKHSKHRLPGIIDTGYGERSKLRLEDHPSGAEELTQLSPEGIDHELFKSKTLKQVKVRREYMRDLKDISGPTTTAKKKEVFSSPYDLENANNYMRNAFKMEVIMSLKEQRKQRPAKYKIKNIKKSKRHNPRQKSTNPHNDGHYEVCSELPKMREGRIHVRDPERSSSPDVKAEESMHSGRSHDKHANVMQSRQNDYLQPSQMNTGAHGKHMINPLRYGKPFDIKLNKNVENEWAPHRQKEGKFSRVGKSKPKAHLDRGVQSKDNSFIYRSDEEAPPRLNSQKLLQRRLLPDENAGRAW